MHRAERSMLYIVSHRSANEWRSIVGVKQAVKSIWNWYESNRETCIIVIMFYFLQVFDYDYKTSAISHNVARWRTAVLQNDMITIAVQFYDGNAVGVIYTVDHYNLWSVLWSERKKNYWLPPISVSYRTDLLWEFLNDQFSMSYCMTSQCTLLQQKQFFSWTLAMYLFFVVLYD